MKTVKRMFYERRKCSGVRIKVPVERTWFPEVEARFRVRPGWFWFTLGSPVAPVEATPGPFKVIFHGC